MAIAATSDNCLLTTHAFVKTHLSYRGTLQDTECLENTDSNLMISKDEGVLKPNQQVFKHKSSKVAEIHNYKNGPPSYNSYQQYLYLFSCVLC